MKKVTGMHRRKTAWVLIDLSNSNPRCVNYLWWFETRALALEHRKHQHAMKNGARLSKPERWIRVNPKAVLD